MSFKIAVVGATGNVGREILKTLAERNFPFGEVVALASENSLGKQVSFGEDEVLDVQDLATYDFKGTNIVFSSAGGKVSAEFAGRAVKAGAIIIDNTAHFRMDPDVPLIVPEVNGDALEGYKKKNIIANPNCSTIQLVMALAPLHRLARIKRVVVSTYQSVSGAGAEAMDELFNQTRAIFMNKSPKPEIFESIIAFNVIPQIDVFMSDGATKEEWKMMVETKKILDPKIKLVATAVRVPVFIGHAEAVTVEFEEEIDLKEAKKAIIAQAGVTYFEGKEGEDFTTPAEIAGEDAVFVSRLRDDSTVDYGLSFWCTADNIRKGAALNAVQIAELLVARYLMKDSLAANEITE